MFCIFYEEAQKMEADDDKTGPCDNKDSNRRVCVEMGTVRSAGTWLSTCCDNKAKIARCFFSNRI